MKMYTVYERWNATANSDKKEAGIFWTCYVIRLIGKRKDAGMRTGKEEERVTKEKMMDGWNTWSNWNEADGTRRRDERKETTEKACHDGRQSWQSS